MDSMHIKWLAMTVSEIVEFRRSIVNSIADGSLEDAVRELASILDLLGFNTLSIRALEIADTLKSIRVKVTSIGGFYTPGVTSVSDDIDKLIDEVKRRTGI